MGSGLGAKSQWGLAGQRNLPETKTVCRYCLQILSRETIEIWKFRTITRGAGAKVPKPPWLTQNFAQWRQDRTWLTQVFRSHWLKWQQCFRSVRCEGSKHGSERPWHRKDWHICTSDRVPLLWLTQLSDSSRAPDSCAFYWTHAYWKIFWLYEFLSVLHCLLCVDECGV